MNFLHIAGHILVNDCGRKRLSTVTSIPADFEDSNVLIIKHPLRDMHRIENMTPTDLACAAKLLRWCVKPGELYRLLITDFLQGCCIWSSVGFKFVTSALLI
jgi:hypothetical protein